MKDDLFKILDGFLLHSNIYWEVLVIFPKKTFS